MGIVLLCYLFVPIIFYPKHGNCMTHVKCSILFVHTLVFWWRCTPRHHRSPVYCLPCCRSLPWHWCSSVKMSTYSNMCRYKALSLLGKLLHTGKVHYRFRYLSKHKLTKIWILTFNKIDFGLWMSYFWSKIIKLFKNYVSPMYL